MNRFRSKNFKTLFPYFLLALAIMGAFQLINQFRWFLDILGTIWGIITPFFYGFLLAYVLNIPRGAIEKLLHKSKVNFIIRRKRGFSVLLIFILFALLFAAILNWAIPAIVQNISLFITNFPTHYENVLRLIDSFNELDLFGIHISTGELSTMFTDMFQGFSLDNLASPLNALVEVSSAIFSGFFVGFLTFISSIYILVEKDKFKAFLSRLLGIFTSAGVNRAIIKYAANLNKNFKRYIYTQTLDGCILGTAAAIALHIMGSPYALVLGIMLGIVNYIPYFGSIFGTLVSVIVVAFTQGLGMGAIAALVLFIIQQLDGNVLQPRLMGTSFSISPLLIIISVTVGGAVAGILGMIAAIPIVAVLKDILESIVEHFEAKKADKLEAEEDPQETPDEAETPDETVEAIATDTEPAEQ